jgi:hypothetical protein
LGSIESALTPPSSCNLGADDGMMEWMDGWGSLLGDDGWMDGWMDVKSISLMHLHMHMHVCMHDAQSRNII